VDLLFGGVNYNSKTYTTLLPAINLYSPPEVSKAGWDTIKQNPVAATDSYDFGILVYEVYNGGTFDSGKVGQTTNIPISIQHSYKRLLNAHPKARLTVSHFLEQGCRNDGFFETPLIRLSQGVENLGLKTDEERIELLRSVLDCFDTYSISNSMTASLMRYQMISQKNFSR
jgi:SCY1-like protein 1